MNGQKVILVNFESFSEIRDSNACERNDDIFLIRPPVVDYAPSHSSYSPNGNCAPGHFVDTIITRLIQTRAQAAL
jgi:hypothetical protein